MKFNRYLITVLSFLFLSQVSGVKTAYPVINSWVYLYQKGKIIFHSAINVSFRDKRMLTLSNFNLYRAGLNGWI